MIPPHPVGCDGISAIVGQVVFGLLALGFLALAPGRTGTFLLVPLTATAANGMAAVAIDDGAALLGRGRLPGSLVVSGERDRLLPSMTAARVLVLAGTWAGCGKDRT